MLFYRLPLWQYQNVEGKPAPKNATTPMREVVGVYADGHELEYLLKIFTGLPCHSSNHPRYGRAIQWRGDMAQFIYDNI